MTLKRAWLSVFIGVLGSQFGHLLAYQIRFGAAAQQLQSSGAHAYFPVLAKTTLGAIAGLFVAGIFVVGLARVLAGRSGKRAGSGTPYIELLAALFTIQLASFIVQEVGEALLTRAPVDTATHLLLWGTLGQLPVAAIAALAIGWLWTRFESAVEDLRTVLAMVRAPLAPVAISAALWPAPDRARLLSQVAGGSLGKRGPPSSSRLSL